MGLDQYAYARKANGEEEEIFYWRKHANLQGWMENLYISKGGVEDFNCERVYLEEDDIDKLENDHRSLEKAEGFFWGASNKSDEERTQEFIEIARDCLKNGWVVYYTSWW